MPRTVRNFWVQGQVDGRRSQISGGPRARDGGLALTLYQRRKGAVETALRVNCSASTDGTLTLEVEPALPFTVSRSGGRLKIKTKR